MYGTFAAGRDNNPGKLSAGCQFYVVHDANGIARLDDNYYGFVFSGMEVVDQIVAVETNESDEPRRPSPRYQHDQHDRAEIEAGGFEFESEQSG